MAGKDIPHDFVMRQSKTHERVINSSMPNRTHQGAKHATGPLSERAARTGGVGTIPSASLAFHHARGAGYAPCMHQRREPSHAPHRKLIAMSETEVVRHRGLITASVMLAMFMQTLDSTICIVALPFMQGSLSASAEEISWVLTSYVIASAIMTAPAAWMAQRFGRKRVFMVCLGGFLCMSILSGLSQSLEQLIVCRLVQGMFGAALAPLCQATMLDIYPFSQTRPGHGDFRGRDPDGPVSGAGNRRLADRRLSLAAGFLCRARTGIAGAAGGGDFPAPGARLILAEVQLVWLRHAGTGGRDVPAHA